MVMHAAIERIFFFVFEEEIGSVFEFFVGACEIVIKGDLVAKIETQVAGFSNDGNVVEVGVVEGFP